MQLLTRPSVDRTSQAPRQGWPSGRARGAAVAKARLTLSVAVDSGLAVESLECRHVDTQLSSVGRSAGPVQGEYRYKGDGTLKLRSQARRSCVIIIGMLRLFTLMAFIAAAAAFNGPAPATRSMRSKVQMSRFEGKIWDMDAKIAIFKYVQRAMNYMMRDRNIRASLFRTPFSSATRARKRSRAFLPFTPPAFPCISRPQRVGPGAAAWLQQLVCCTCNACVAFSLPSSSAIPGPPQAFARPREDEQNFPLLCSYALSNPHPSSARPSPSRIL